MAKKNASSSSTARYHKLKRVDDGYIDLQPCENSKELNEDEVLDKINGNSDICFCPSSCFLPSVSKHTQFQKPETKVPWKAILLAIILFVVGSAMLVTSSLIFTGYIEHAEGGNWALLILGLIMFIPGSYHVWIAYYAYRQYPGYTFDDIPDFD